MLIAALQITILGFAIDFGVRHINTGRVMPTVILWMMALASRDQAGLQVGRPRD